MKYVDPTFLARSRAAFLSENQRTLADVKRLAEADTALTTTQRRDLVSALNRIEQLFQTPLEKLEASPRRVRELFASQSAGPAEPVREDLRQHPLPGRPGPGALCAPALPLTQRIPIAPSWQALLDRIEVPYQRQALYRLATYCSVMGIPPDEVTTADPPRPFRGARGGRGDQEPEEHLKNTIVELEPLGPDRARLAQQVLCPRRSSRSRMRCP